MTATPSTALGQRISARAAAVSPSATLAVDAKAKALQAAGEHVIGFGAGEPDFPTPEAIVEAAVAACRVPANHHYSPTAGLPELRAAIADKTLRDSGLAVGPSQVLVTNGGKQAVANAFAVLCDPGDEVLVPAPYWTTYPEAIALAGGVPVIVADQGRPGSGSRWPTSRRPGRHGPRSLLFVSPSNPTGAVYPKAEIEAIGRWALDAGLWVLTDEIYEHLVYGEAEHHSMPVLVPELADRCLVVNGVAKTYAMTGWRVGWLIGPDDAITAATNIQSHETSNVANVSQRAALAAVSGDLSAVADDASRLRPAAPDHRAHAERDRGGDLRRARGGLLRLPFGRGTARPVHPGTPARHLGRAGRAVHRRGQGGDRARRGLRRPRVLPHVLRHGRRRHDRRGQPAGDLFAEAQTDVGPARAGGRWRPAGPTARSTTARSTTPQAAHPQVTDKRGK